MPSRIGRYVVRRRIGAGGFATVWLAYDDRGTLADRWEVEGLTTRQALHDCSSELSSS